MIGKVPPAAILSDAGRAFRATASIAVPLAIVFELPLVAAELASDEPLGLEGKALFALISLLSQGAILVLADRALRDEPLELGAALRASGRAYARMLITAIVSELLVILFLVLLIVPGLLRALSYAIAMPIALHEGPMGRAACDLSAERVLGSRGSIALTLLPAWLLPNVIDLGTSIAAQDRASAWALPSTAALAAIAVALSFLPLLYLTAALYHRTRAPEPAAAPASMAEPQRARAKARPSRRARG